ncbi:MAG: T9SS type B sorting domain-containing protein [Flavobacteriales bacterium]|nr:T9SS type B sorting domain-containing protein [Flavobacteriales bacterium]
MKHYLLFLSVLVTCSIWSQTPTANFTVSDDLLCAGDCISITNNSSSNTLAYEWTFTGALPSTYSGQNPGLVCFNNAGTFTISLTVTNTFGSNTATQTITVGQIPSILVTLSDTTSQFTIPNPATPPTPPTIITYDNDSLEFVEIADTTVDMFQEVYLYAEGFPAGGTLMWYVSCVEADSISGCYGCAGGDSLTATPFAPTCYCVSYTTANGCSVTDSICVNVRFRDNVKVVLPNTFTPNEDGENDVFRILTNVDIDNDFNNGFTKEGGAIAEIDMRIYDRYGKMVYRTTDPHEGWDGTYKGKKVNPATYTYYVSYRRIDGRSDELKGNVTLIR